MVLNLESQQGYWIFFNPKTGEEISEPLNTQDAIDFIWSIKSGAR